MVPILELGWIEGGGLLVRVAGLCSRRAVSVEARGMGLALAAAMERERRLAAEASMGIVEKGKRRIFWEII